MNRNGSAPIRVGNVPGHEAVLQGESGSMVFYNVIAPTVYDTWHLPAHRNYTKQRFMRK